MKYHKIQDQDRTYYVQDMVLEEFNNAEWVTKKYALADFVIEFDGRLSKGRLTLENLVDKVTICEPPTSESTVLELTLLMKIDLIKTKVEILKLKADSYEWQCHVPVDVKTALDKTLAEINQALGIPL